MMYARYLGLGVQKKWWHVRRVDSDDFLCRLKDDGTISLKLFISAVDWIVQEKN